MDKSSISNKVASPKLFNEQTAAVKSMPYQWIKRTIFIEWARRVHFGEGEWGEAHFTAVVYLMFPAKALFPPFVSCKGSGGFWENERTAL